MESQNPNPEAQYTMPPATPARNPYEKTPLLACILSVVPGLGNIYNGLYVRGLAFTAVCVGLFAVAVASPDSPILALLIPALLFFWMFNIIDAYRQAVLINFGHLPAPELPSTLSAPGQASGGLVLGVAIFVVGFYGFLRHAFPNLDLSILVEFWYFGFLAFGGWLILQTVREKRRSQEEDLEEELSISSVADSVSDSEAA